MSTLWSKLENNPTLKNVYVLLRMAGPILANLGDKLKHVGHLVVALAHGLLLVSPASRSQDA